MKHVVVGIIIKDNPLSYLLVASKKYFGEFTGYYYPPGGHVKHNEDEFSALKREIYEELGMNVKRAEKLSVSTGDVKDQKTSWYVCSVDSTNINVNKAELLDARFFTREEMKSINVWPATREIFEKYVFNKVG
ncbi:MAG TPA: NUDIX hydrolase [Candidatus Woesebacteria bacterium]|nr:NUDIX hydrolase [Candidatus Woesebacteria bacterium]HNS95216.1 NUDIX hydrolase [Candidatus Woesebacteria bacterium]